MSTPYPRWRGLTRREAVLSNQVVLVVDHFAASAAINSPQRA